MLYKLGKDSTDFLDDIKYIQDIIPLVSSSGQTIGPLLTIRHLDSIDYDKLNECIPPGSFFEFLIRNINQDQLIKFLMTNHEKRQDFDQVIVTLAKNYGAMKFEVNQNISKAPFITCDFKYSLDDATIIFDKLPVVQERVKFVAKVLKIIYEYLQMDQDTYSLANDLINSGNIKMMDDIGFFSYKVSCFDDNNKTLTLHILPNNTFNSEQYFKHLLQTALNIEESSLLLHGYKDYFCTMHRYFKNKKTNISFSYDNNITPIINKKTHDLLFLKKNIVTDYCIRELANLVYNIDFGLLAMHWIIYDWSCEDEDKNTNMDSSNMIELTLDKTKRSETYFSINDSNRTKAIKVNIEESTSFKLKPVSL